MKKGIALSVLIVSMFLFSLAFTSALEFDNVKSYDPITREVTITNSFGLGADIGKARLNTPLKVDVAPGYNKVAEFDLWAYEDYNNVLKSIEFYDKNQEDWEKHKFTREYDIKKKGYENVLINDYKTECYFNEKIQNQTCEQIKTESHYELRETWTKITPADLKKNEVVTIGIFTNVQSGDYVEWIPQIYGVKINEWATWESDLKTGLQLYYPLDNITGVAIDVHGSNDGTVLSGTTRGVAGKINYSYSFDANGEGIDFNSQLTNMGDFTFNWWQKVPTGDDMTIFDKISGNDDVIRIESNHITFRSRSLGGSDISFSTQEISNNIWEMITLIRDGSNVSLYLDGDYIGSGSNSDPLDIDTIGYDRDYSTLYMNGNLDEIGIWNRDLTEEEIIFLYNNGTGLTYEDDGLIDEAPIINLNSPSSANYTSDQNVTINLTASDDVQISDVKLYVNDVLNQTNATGLNNTNYLFDLSLGEGDYTIYGKVTDNNSAETNSNSIRIVIDKTTPIVENLAINQSGQLYGYPQSFSISNDINDTHLQSCWYNTNYNSTNLTFTCDSNITLTNVPEGNNTITIFGNDSFGWENSSNLDFEVDYFTHNITYKDNLTDTILYPNCEFIDGNVTTSPYYYDTHNTTERIVNCSLFGYGSFNHTLTESNKTSYDVDVAPANLWLIFDGTTDVKISWLGGGLAYSSVTSINVPMRNISMGRIHVEFNNETQLYSFNNDNNTLIKEYLHIETPDLDQQIKVLSSSNEIANAWVIFKKYDNESEQVTYSAYTDVNGIAHILVDDGTSYNLYVYKDGYEDYSELVYIPHSNTETLIVNLINEDESLADYIFQPSCGNYVGIPRNCTFYVKSYKDTTIKFNYTWNGNDYYVEHEGSEATLTLLVNSTTIPINVTASVNPTKTYSILWEGLGDRSIQLEFDENEIKDAGNEILGLFYLIVIIIGLIIALSINRIPATQGYGAIGFLIWTGIIAVKFPLLWFIAIPGALYYIFKALWGEQD